MQHRHLNHQRFTLAAIDDVIRRGRWDDWLSCVVRLLKTALCSIRLSAFAPIALLIHALSVIIFG